MQTLEAQDVPEVQVATQSEIRTAIASALAALGVTRADLETQARADSFDSERARLLWSAIRSAPPA